jgi:hypothetical protein
MAFQVARVLDLPLDLVFQYEALSHDASGTPSG